MSAMRLLLPVLLGGIAAILNFVVLRGGTAPLELTALNVEVKADTELKADMLQPLAVRADPEIFKSAVPYAKRGLLLGRRVTRALGPGEALLYNDVQDRDEESIRLYLNPGETTLTIPIKPSRVAPGLKRGDSVGVLVAVKPAVEPTKTLIRTQTTTRMLGPFRLLSLGTPVEVHRGMSFGEVRQVLVAIKPGPDGQVAPMVASLQEAIAARPSFGSGNDSGVLSVEYYQGGK